MLSYLAKTSPYTSTVGWHVLASIYAEKRVDIMNQTKYKQSPMNYTGNKYKLLPQLLPLFPDADNVATFYDAFCGGLAVSLNVPYTNIQSQTVSFIFGLG